MYLNGIQGREFINNSLSNTNIMPRRENSTLLFYFILYFYIRCCYRGADKSLARPGRKQATATEDFDVHISYL